MQVSSMYKKSCSVNVYKLSNPHIDVQCKAQHKTFHIQQVQVHISTRMDKYDLKKNRFSNIEMKTSCNGNKPCRHVHRKTCFKVNMCCMHITSAISFITKAYMYLKLHKTQPQISGRIRHSKFFKANHGQRTCMLKRV